MIHDPASRCSIIDEPPSRITCSQLWVGKLDAGDITKCPTSLTPRNCCEMELLSLCCCHSGQLKPFTYNHQLKPNLGSCTYAFSCIAKLSGRCSGQFYSLQLTVVFVQTCSTRTEKKCVMHLLHNAKPNLRCTKRRLYW